MALVSYLNAYRTRKELNLVKFIRYRVKKEKLLRVIDKSGIFRIGHKNDYEQKAEGYRQKTGAYMELETNPSPIAYDKVVHLLNQLRSKKHIEAWQLNKMMPKREDVELFILIYLEKISKIGFSADLWKTSSYLWNLT
ncbi:unnamed protein product [Didymodactylos carnosus]|uniref:Uncharacterized protein n=1 Tax=Didymodactylos carnosus TaxID=1234261 RepID=A0A815Q1I0_9BILA|nr:unnamed protein product [Didymodactylos carnosus]CAF4328763.1 unnamed protein product [Didymodactylos carnosus]